jgi:hypothetical protein
LFKLPTHARDFLYVPDASSATPGAHRDRARPATSLCIYNTQVLDVGQCLLDLFTLEDVVPSQQDAVLKPPFDRIHDIGYGGGSGGGADLPSFPRPRYLQLPTPLSHLKCLAIPVAANPLLFTELCTYAATLTELEINGVMRLNDLSKNADRCCPRLRHLRFVSSGGGTIQALASFNEKHELYAAIDTFVNTTRLETFTVVELHNTVVLDISKLAFFRAQPQSSTCSTYSHTTLTNIQCTDKILLDDRTFGSTSFGNWHTTANYVHSV